MKTLYKGLLGLALTLATLPSPAQNKYYRFNVPAQIPQFDHGESNMVLALANGHYVVTGGVFDNSLVPAPGLFIAEYDAAGTPVWTKIYWSNSGPATFVGGAITALANGYAIAGDFQTGATHNGVLIVVDNAGLFVASRVVSNGPATDVAYDPVNKQIAVLSGTTGVQFTDYAFHLTIYDETTIANTPAVLPLVTMKYKASAQTMDTPCRLEYTVAGYTLVGTTFNFIQHDVMVVRTDLNGNLVCTNTYGKTDRDEFGISSQSNMICAQSLQYNNNIPFYTPLAISTIPCSQVYNAALLQPASGSNLACAITYNGTDFVFAGVNNGTSKNGFAITFDPNLTTAAGQLFGQTAQPGNEEFHDVIAGGNKLVFCGSHQKLGAWAPGTTAALNYPWLVVANNQGVGTCSENIDVAVVPYELLVENAFISNPDLNYPEPNFSINHVTQSSLDECTNPFRLAVSDKTKNHLYPNPAADQIAVDLSEFDAAAEMQMEIRNITGQLVRCEKMFAGATVTVSLSGLADGIYTCTISENGSFVRREKMIIQH